MIFNSNKKVLNSCLTIEDCMQDKIKINKKKRREFSVHIGEVNKQVGSQTTNTLRNCDADTNMIYENISTLSKNCEAFSDVSLIKCT